MIWFLQNTDNAQVYINSIIVGCTSICGNVAAASLIRFIGKKKILSMDSFVLLMFYWKTFFQLLP